MFSGKVYCTSGVDRLLSKATIGAIYQDVIAFVKEKNGIDYLVVYQHEETGQKLFFIDQLNESEDSSKLYEENHNYATLLLADEY
jgi:hypothetical protein